MNFASDNTCGASPAILQAIVDSNGGTLPSYGADPWTAKAKAELEALFGPGLAVALVTTGTAANALALGTVVPTGGVTFCHEFAHIIEEECAAPEFYTGAGKLVGVPGRAGKIDPDALAALLKRYPRGVPRQAQPAALSLSEATESGTLYTPAEVRRLSTIAHEAGLVVHMDGARFANAVAALGCTAAALSRDAGVDVLSLGATKNGALGCEAVVFFDAARAASLPYMLKRGGHMLSKGRLLGAQMAAYLGEGHWLDLARHSNSMAQRLAAGLGRLPGVQLPWPVEANELFPILPVAMSERVAAAGAVFYPWETAYLPPEEQPGPDSRFVRLICSHATTPAEVDQFLDVAAG